MVCRGERVCVGGWGGCAGQRRVTEEPTENRSIVPLSTLLDTSSGRLPFTKLPGKLHVFCLFFKSLHLVVIMLNRFTLWCFIEYAEYRWKQIINSRIQIYCGLNDISPVAQVFSFYYIYWKKRNNLIKCRGHKLHLNWKICQNQFRGTIPIFNLRSNKTSTLSSISFQLESYKVLGNHFKCTISMRDYWTNSELHIHSPDMLLFLGYMGFVFPKVKLISCYLA